jgi:hypothetical protein
MKNIYEVLREKETNLTRLRTEVEALRFVAPLLVERSDENDTNPPDLRLAPAMGRNKWPLTVDDPAPTYLDS